MEVPEVMATLLSSTAGVSRTGNAVTEHETYIPMQVIPIDSMNHIGRNSENHSLGDFIPGAPSYTLTKQHSHAVAHETSYGIPENWIGRKPENGGNAVEPMHNVAPCLTKTDQHGVAHPIQIVHGTQDPCVSNSHAFALGRNNGGENVLMKSMAVRRLTPVECERLQGFPDHYTDIKPKGKLTPDGPRYKALGNSWAVPVARWIGERIMQVERLKNDIC
jgi:site-specific DNA-cytosine methylase